MVAARGVFKAMASAQSAKSSPLHLDVLGIAVPSAAALDDATTEHVPARACDCVDVASLWRRRGLLLMGEGNYERALAVLQDAVKASRTPAAVNNLAIAALFNNKVQPCDGCSRTERKTHGWRSRRACTQVVEAVETLEGLIASDPLRQAHATLLHEASLLTDSVQ